MKHLAAAHSSTLVLDILTSFVWSTLLKTVEFLLHTF